MTQNELPVGWVKCKLEDICYLDNGDKVSGVNLPLLDVKYIRGKKEAEYRSAGVILEANDYVILVDGENSGEIFKIKEKGIMGSTFKKISFRTAESIRYALYVIRSCQKLFRENKRGSAIPHLDKKLFKEYPINLPPLAEQKRIVGKIEELFAEVDKGIDLLKQKQAELKKYRQSVLSAAFSGKLYKTTEWPKIKLKSTMYLKNGYAFQSSSYKKEGIPLIRISDIDGQYVTLDSTAKIAPSEAPEGFRVEKDDLLIAMSGATTGKLGVYTADEPALQNQRVGNIKIKDENKVIKKYRNYLFMHLQKEILKNAYGGAQPNISSSKIEDMDFLLPTLPEQERIVAEIEQRFEKADILEKSIEDALESAEKLKQSILKKAFEGTLVPQDPNDEPASVLLEGIKSEQSPKKGKRK